MPRSMTGFAAREQVVGEARIAWRMKSVNHRFLDLSMRVPEGCDSLELLAARRLKERFARGRLECVLTLVPDGRGERAIELNQGLLTGLLDLEKRLREQLEDGMERAPLSLDRLLSWPGMTRERRVVEDLETETGRAAVLELLEETCQELDLVRGGEGEALVGVMRGLLEALSARVVEVEVAIPQARRVMEERLRERVMAFCGSDTALDEGLGRELAFLLNRMDIAEEADRLRVHIREMESLLAGEAPVGLRLDFLCQELNREANTLCSKAQDGELSRLGVELKVIIEQLREQARNLE
ncbi:MAG: YicC family protein [Magnetococcales bacterium]|nr:YicC family protein [Magnetococcales bacterium]